MIEFYAEIRLVHIAAVLTSGGLFLLRGLSIDTGARWPMAMPVRVLGHTIDTVLLTAALMLTSIVQQYPFVHGWLTVKVILLIAYVVLGSFALKRGRTRAVRSRCFLAALVVYGLIISVARAHHPWGLLAMSLVE